MKTSLKQLGHSSEVVCGKGFWGHVCSGMFIYLHEYVWTIDITRDRGYTTPPPQPTFPSIPLSSGHTSKQHNQPHIWCLQRKHSQSKAAAHPLLFYLLSNRNFSLFLTKKVQVRIHFHVSHFSDHFSKQDLTQIKEYHHYSSTMIPCLDKILTGHVSRLDGTW